MRMIVFSAALALAAPAMAQQKETVGQAAGDIATQPLQDTNIKRKQIPEILELARGGPYRAEGTRNCATIASEIGQLNAVLGADFDTAQVRTIDRGRQAANVGKTVMQSLIPFRGVIREVTGAAAGQREWDAAVDAGIARRGYLRANAQMRRCAGAN